VIKPQTIRRAIELGAIIPEADGTVTDQELFDYINQGSRITAMTATATSWKELRVNGKESAIG